MSLVVPGTVLGTRDEYECGSGCAVWKNDIRSTLCGEIVIQSTSSGRKIVHVRPQKKVSSLDQVIGTGDTVICQVQRITINQVIVDIFCVGDTPVRDVAKGTIRKEDVTTRSIEVDTIVMHECFRPGDIVRAEVVSLGDSRQYFLSTAGPTLGVIGARSNSGNIMKAINSKVISCLQCCFVIASLIQCPYLLLLYFSGNGGSHHRK